MACWKCAGSGTYLVTRFDALANEYRVVEKDCDCKAGHK